MTKFKAKWNGVFPKFCEICGHPINGFFVDGKTHEGKWVNMCNDCHTTNGVGIGDNLGKMYEVPTGKLLHG